MSNGKKRERKREEKEKKKEKTSTLEMMKTNGDDKKQRG